jgi:hypothetical protein
MVGKVYVFAMRSTLTTFIYRAEYVEPAKAASFREACTRATMSSLDDALRPFFITWTTSLMGKDLEKLKSVSTEPRIRTLIETLIVQDECNTLDPFAVPGLPSPDSTYRIWPRNESGVVIASEIGVVELSHMLHERLLCPSTIIIRNYRIDPINMLLCEEFARFRTLVRDIPQAAAEPVPIAAFVRDIIEDANLDVQSLVFQHVDPGYGEQSVLSSADFRKRFPDGISVASPAIREAIIEVDTAYQGAETRLSNLRSADLQLGQEAQLYWLQHIFYKATELKTLKLSLRTSQNQQLEAEMVVPRLTEFSLGNSKISASDLLAMIASSKESLTHITFQQVVLNHGSKWQEALTYIAKEYRALASFKLSILRETDDGGPAVDFREVRDEDITEQCRPGLKLTPKGPDGNKRVTRLAYSGIDARKVLEVIAAIGYIPESYDPGRRQNDKSA